MSKGYIDREEVILAVRHAWAKGLEPTQYIEQIPAADVAPVRRGNWEEWWPDKSDIMTGEEKLYQCSACDAKCADVDGYNNCWTTSPVWPTRQWPGRSAAR